MSIILEKRKKPAFAGFSAGRSGVIRTLDPHVPNVVRYQTALHSVTSGASYRTGFWFPQAQNIKKSTGLRKKGDAVGKNAGAGFGRLRGHGTDRRRAFPKTGLPYPVMLARMVGAVLPGAVIGVEREYRSRAPCGGHDRLLAGRGEGLATGAAMWLAGAGGLARLLVCRHGRLLRRALHSRQDRDRRRRRGLGHQPLMEQIFRSGIIRSTQ